MITQLKISGLLLGIILLHGSMHAQKNNWQTEKSDDGTITVQHKYSEQSCSNGDKQQVVEYVAFTTTHIPVSKLAAILNNVSIHKEFLDQKTSLKIKSLSDNECVVYYFYKGFWPYPSSDIVAKMTSSEDANKKEAMFTLTAAPTLLEDKGVKRLENYHLTYLFKALNNGTVEIKLTSKFTPAIQLPAFMMNAWFPDGPADYIKKIISLANKIN